MHFEVAGNGHRTAIFEADNTTKFHEQFVAASALGVLTSKRRRDPQQRAEASKLGTRIGSLASSRSEGETSVAVDTSMPLTRGNAELLSAALREFIADTPNAIHLALITSSPRNCNVRGVEAAMAEVMLEQLAAEFDLPAAVEPVPFGFG